jgi:hypothetical protein
MKKNKSNVQSSWLSDVVSKFGAQFTDGSSGASFSATADGTQSYHATYDDTGIYFTSKVDYMDTNCPAGDRIFFGSTMKGIYPHTAIPNNETYRMSGIGTNEYQRFFTLENNRMETKKVKGTLAKDMTSYPHSGHFLNDVFGLADCGVGDESGEYVNPPSADSLLSNVLFEYSVDDSSTGMGKYQQYAFIPFNMATGAPGSIGQPNLNLTGKTSDWNNIGWEAPKYTSSSGYERSMHVDGLSFIEYANMDLTNSWNPFKNNYDWPWSGTKKDWSFKKILDDYANRGGSKLYKNVDIYKDKKTIVNTSNIRTHHADDPRSYLHLKGENGNWLDDHYTSFQSPGAQGYLGSDVEYFPSELYPINLTRSAAAWDILYGKHGARKGDQSVSGTFASGQSYTGFTAASTEGVSTLKVEYVFCEAMQEQTSTSGGRFDGLAAIYEDCPIVERDGNFYIQTKNVLWWKHLFPWYYVSGTIPGDVFPGMSNLPPDHNFYSWVNIYGNSEWTTCASCKGRHQATSNDATSPQLGMHSNSGSSSTPSFLNSSRYRQNFSDIFENSSLPNIIEKNHKIQTTQDISEFALEGLKTDAFNTFSESFNSSKENKIYKHTFKTDDPELFFGGNKLTLGYYWLNANDRDSHAYKDVEIESTTKYFDGTTLNEDSLEKITSVKRPRIETLKPNKKRNFKTVSRGWNFFNFKLTHDFNPFGKVDLKMVFTKNISFDYQIYIDSKFLIKEGRFTGDVLDESIDVTMFDNIDRFAIRIYNTDYVKNNYSLLFQPQLRTHANIVKKSICAEKLSSELNKLTFDISYATEDSRDIKYTIKTTSDTKYGSIKNVYGMGTVNVVETIDPAEKFLELLVYLPNSNEKRNSENLTDRISSFKECGTASTIYTESSIIYSLQDKEDTHIISFLDNEYILGDTLSLPQTDVKLDNDDIEFFNLVVGIRNEDGEQIDVSDEYLKSISTYENYSFEKINNKIKIKFLSKQKIIRNDLWNLPVEPTDIRYNLKIKNKKQYSGNLKFVQSTLRRQEEWIEEYFEGIHTNHSFETEFEVKPIIPSPNFSERNHVILGRSSPLHQSVYTTNNFSKIAELEEDITENEEETIQDLDVNTVVDTKDFMNEVMLSKEGQIVTQLSHQFHNLIFYQHTVNEGAWLSGTDTLFYLLDTVGGFIDGKGMVLGGAAKVGAKAARVAPHMGKIGKVSSVLDDTLGLKGLSSLGKLGMHTVGHSAKQIKFMQAFGEWCIKKGITTSDSLRVAYTTVDSAGNIVSNPGYVAGILDHFGLWKMPPSKSKIGISTARKSSPNEYYSKLLETTDELNLNNLGKYNENPSKFQVDDQQSRIVDDFFDDVMGRMGDDILKAENVDRDMLPIGPIDQYFNQGNFWTDIVSEDTYKVWRTIQPDEASSKGAKLFKNGLPTDSAIVTKHGDKEIFLPLEIIPEKHREVVVSWLNSNPQKVTSDMQKFIDEHMPIWTFMHKLHLLDKYANLDYDSLMKILAVSDKLFGNPAYYSKTGIGFLGGANRGVIEKTLVRLVDKTDAAFSSGGTPFKMTKNIINGLEGSELEKVVTSFASNFDKTLKLNGKNSKYLKNIEDQAEHFTKAETELTELQSRISNLLKPADGKTFKETARNTLKTNMSGNDSALDLNPTQNYLLAYIERVVPYNAKPAETLSFVNELKQTSQSISLAKNNITSNKLKTQKIKDKINAGEEIGIEIETSLAKHNEERKAFYKADNVADLVDGTKFDRIFKIKFSDELTETSPVQKFMDAMPKLRDALRASKPKRELLAFNRFYNDQYWAMKEFNLGTSGYIEIKELLRKHIVTANTSMAKDIWKNISYFKYDGISVEDIALFQNMTKKEVLTIQKLLDKIIVEPASKVEESSLDQIFYILNNPGAVDESTEALAREVFEQINILSSQADNNLDKLAGYGKVVKNSEIEDATRRLNKKTITESKKEVFIENDLFTRTIGEGSGIDDATQSAILTANKLMDDILSSSNNIDPVLSKPVAKLGKFKVDSTGNKITQFRIKYKDGREFWVSKEIADEYTKTTDYKFVLDRNKKPITQFEQELGIKNNFKFSAKDVLKNVTNKNLVDDYISYVHDAMGNPQGKQFFERVGADYEYVNGVATIKKSKKLGSDNVILGLDEFAEKWIAEQSYQITTTIRKTIASRLKDFKKIRVAKPRILNDGKAIKGNPPKNLDYDFRINFTPKGSPVPRFKYYKLDYVEEPVNLDKIMSSLGLQNDAGAVPSNVPSSNLWTGNKRNNLRTAGDYYKSLEENSITRVDNVTQDGFNALIKESLYSTTGLRDGPGLMSEYGSLQQLRQLLLSQFPMGINPVKITDDINNPAADDLVKILDSMQEAAQKGDDVKVTISEVSSSGANGYKVPDTYESDFARPGITNHMDNIEDSGRGVFGTSNHDHSVFHGLLELEKMSTGNYLSLEELAKSIHKGWKNSGISRKQTKKNLGSLLGVVGDIKTLDLQTHILALHDIMIQPGGPIRYMLERGLQGKTDRANLKKILSTFTRTTRFSQVVNVNGKNVNIINELFRRSPGGGYSRKYVKNQPSVYPPGHEKVGQPIPANELKYELVPDVDGPYQRNGDAAGPYVVSDMNPTDQENYKNAITKFFENINNKIKNSSGKELEEILNELPTGGTHPNVNYVQVNSNLENPLFVPDMDFRVKEIDVGGGASEIKNSSPDFQNWIKYLEKNSLVSRAEKVGPEQSFDGILDFSEKVKDLPTATTLLTQYPEFLRKYLGEGVSIDDIEMLYHLRSKRHGDDPGYAAINNFLGADITSATEIKLPGTSRNVIVDEGGSVLQGQNGGIDNVSPEGYGFKSSSTSSSGASATDELLNVTDDMLEQYNKLNNATIFDFAKILGKSKFIEAILKKIPTNKIVDVFDRNKALGLYFTAHTGLFSKLGNVLKQGGKVAKGKTGDAATSASALAAQAQNWKWNTPLKAGPGIIFTPISSWVAAYSHLARALGNTSSVTSADWNSTISGIVNERGLPQDQMCAMFVWDDSESIDLGIEQFSWQMGHVGHAVGVPVVDAMKLISRNEGGSETDITDPDWKESYSDTLKANANSIATTGSAGGSGMSYSVSVGEMGVPLYAGIYGSTALNNLIDDNPNPGVCWSAKEQASRGYGFYEQEFDKNGQSTFSDYSKELHSQDVCFACWNSHFPEAFCKESDEWPCSTEDGSIDLEADGYFTETAGRYMGVNTDYYDMDPGTYTFSTHLPNGMVKFTKKKKGIPTPKNQGAIDPDFRPNFT